MALSTYFGTDPFLGQLDNVFDRAFDRALGRGFGYGPAMTNLPIMEPGMFRSVAGTHPMDVIETENAYELHADAPGMKPDEVKVELDQNTLTISGEHKEEKKHEERGKVWRSERTFRKFTRSFMLPENTKSDEITASLENGVLKITVPKTPESAKPQPKRITVGSAGGGSQALPGTAGVHTTGQAGAQAGRTQ